MVSVSSLTTSGGPSVAMGRFTFPGYKCMDMPVPIQSNRVNKKARPLVTLNVVQLKHVYRRLLWARSKDKARKALGVERFVGTGASFLTKENLRLFELTKEIFLADVVTEF